MTPDQIATFRITLEASRQPVRRAEQYAHPRGWNDCLDFVARTLNEALGETEHKPREAP